MWTRVCCDSWCTEENDFEHLGQGCGFNGFLGCLSASVEQFITSFWSPACAVESWISYIFVDLTPNADKDPDRH